MERVIFLKAKEYLRQAYRLHDLIQSNKEELKNLKELSISLPGTDYSKERVQTSNSADARYTEIIAKIDELERVIQQEIDDMLALKLEIRNVINSVKDNSEKLVLKYRYLNFFTWDNICYRMNISLKTVHRIHNNALKNVKVDTL
jgi:DNA-directed RNA polymerase specialized sigma subunit